LRYTEVRHPAAWGKMKIAVFSDAQGNLPAMEAVMEDILAWGPDLVVMNDDLVNRGPLSLSRVGRWPG
jgi:hypothetical protein